MVKHFVEKNPCGAGRTELVNVGIYKFYRRDIVIPYTLPISIEYDILNEIDLSYKVLQQNVFNSRTINLSVKTGDMVIFPGWCEHMALPNENDSPRIILGTNYFVTGSFGDYDNKDLIQI